MGDSSNSTGADGSIDYLQNQSGGGPGALSTKLAAAPTAGTSSQYIAPPPAATTTQGSFMGISDPKLSAMAMAFANQMGLGGQQMDALANRPEPQLKVPQQTYQWVPYTPPTVSS